MYSGTVPNLTALGSSSSPEGNSRVRVPVTQGEVVYLTVDGFNGERGTIVLRLWMEPGPTVLHIDPW